MVQAAAARAEEGREASVQGGMVEDSEAEALAAEVRWVLASGRRRLAQELGPWPRLAVGSRAAISAVLCALANLVCASTCVTSTRLQSSSHQQLLLDLRKLPLPQRWRQRRC